MKHRISQHGLDVILKLEARHLGDALGRRFGIPLPRIVRPLPVELPVVDIHLERMDTLFEAEDRSAIHLEFQTEHRRKTNARFLVYDALLYEQIERRIHTVVFYGAGIARAPDEILLGKYPYGVYNIYLGSQDGGAIYRRLLDKMQRNMPLAPEDLLDMVFLPLMRHRRSRRSVVRDAVSLARRLSGPEQRQTLASLIGLGHRFLEDNELDTLMEGLMTTPIYDRIIDRGMKEGIERGLQQGLQQGLEMGRHAVLRVLAKQFGEIPAETQARIAAVNDINTLDALLDSALEAGSLEEFSASLTRGEG